MLLNQPPTCNAGFLHETLHKPSSRSGTSSSSPVQASACLAFKHATSLNIAGRGVLGVSMAQTSFLTGRSVPTLPCKARSSRQQVLKPDKQRRKWRGEAGSFQEMLCLADANMPGRGPAKRSSAALCRDWRRTGSCQHSPWCFAAANG